MIQGELQIGGALFIGLIATIWDIKYRKVPNWLTLPAVAAGIILNEAINLKDWAFPLWGVLAGFLILIIPYFLGGIGAGDVKLLMALGAFLGVKGIVWVTLYGAVAGGALSLFWIIRRNGLAGGLFRAGSVWKTLRNQRRRRACRETEKEEESGEKLSIPYAVAIFIGIISFVMIGGR